MNPETWRRLTRGEARGPSAALARAGLRLASLPYGVGARVRNALFDVGWKRSFRAAVPVISVGNLTVGGTGKTPCVEAVARFFRDDGLAVCVLSRGYGADAGPNDEAMVLEENLPDVPHLQGADRTALAMTAVEELEAEVLVLDDGFQHRRLHRDLDIVLVDASWPLAREATFPRGGLRESVGGLRRAGLILLTRCDQAAEPVEAEREWITRRAPGVPVATSEHRAVELVGASGTSDLGSVRGRPVAGFCGLGNPDAFRRTLSTLGADVRLWRTFPDHHPYTRADVDDLSRWAAALPADGLVLTTQKDWVKLRVADLGGRPLGAVRVGLTITGGGTEFAAALRGVLAR